MHWSFVSCVANGCFKKDDVCFLRRELHPQEVSSETIIPRGARGTVFEVRASDHTVKVHFPDIKLYVRCQPDWLESSPGTICIGINAMVTCRKYPFYSTGMMVSDISFPTADKLCYPRFCQHQRILLSSGLGFSFYDGMDATNTRWQLTNTLGPSSEVLDGTVGLILCEEIWPKDRKRWGPIENFHAAVARSLMEQWENATIVMALRSWNAKLLERKMGPIARLSYFHGPDAFRMHYVPLQMGGEEPPIPVRGATWSAVVIHPTSRSDRLITSAGRLYIPEMVLKAMFSKKSTLQLCAYTCESTLSCMRYLEFIKKLHGV